ncbi:MAG: hypothetical protein RLY20_1470 [Verrucomicrobiota bacterium]|jgi:membrane associated rhomboid family serine protease
MGLYDRDYMREEKPGYFSRPRRSAPWSATIILLVTLGVIFLVQVAMMLRGNRWMEYELGLSLAGILKGHIWQLLTFQFLHGSVLHIVLNGVTLYSFGRFLEQQLGRGRFLALYFISGTAGGLLQVLATMLLRQDASTPVVGASAGIAGLLGAFMLSYPDIPLMFFPIPFKIRAWTMLWIVLPLSVIGSIFPFGGIAHAAHLGGLLAGGAFIRWTWRARRRPTPPPVIISSMPPPPKIVASPNDYIASEVDPILDKIAKQGIHSLTDHERKVLETARSKMQKH